MKKAPFSPYLESIAPGLKELVRLLGARYDYASVHSADSVGFRLSISQKSKSVSDANMTTERGCVVRVCKNSLYAEYAFNEFDPERPRDTFDRLVYELDAQLETLAAAGVEPYATGILPDEKLELFVEKPAGILPEEADISALVERLTAISDKGVSEVEGALDCAVSGTSTHISKMFISPNRFLRQSYVYTEGNYFIYAPDARGEMKSAYEGVSGCGGIEILDGLAEKILDAPKVMKDLFDAGKIVPGEYEIITDPDVSGLIAHEAFGHGVEMDMFVKHRALGAEYIGKRVGSDLVTMHEGAKCSESVTAFVFDDEGTLAGDVTEIDHGILKAGICDALSALRLGVSPTGNGKRENYAHKVYTRMTNTLFDPGDSTLDEMIASVKHGYLLSGSESGMEDPKHWGIQCIASRGYEIVDGKLTGKVVAPIVMTGCVPDLLGNVSMASGGVGVFGTGACGKGHKEWVKVADGGPYLKTKARLG
ncbi:MAG: TldD/PmbA family protein [Clostridia bacterium]|nr:TldD/PmbA family protein [Clostridia bacterium]